MIVVTVTPPIDVAHDNLGHDMVEFENQMDMAPKSCREMPAGIF
jgi:hypothetical protein